MDYNEELSKLNGRILSNLNLLRGSLDRLWNAAQALPPGPARTQIELTHQCMVAILLDLDTSPPSPSNSQNQQTTS